MDGQIKKVHHVSGVLNGGVSFILALKVKCIWSNTCVSVCVSVWCIQGNNGEILRLYWIIWTWINRTASHELYSMSKIPLLNLSFLI